MVVEMSRRSLVFAILGGVTITGATGYGWSEYRRRHHLDLSLIGNNRSNEPVELSVTVLEDGDVFYERTDDLGATGDEQQSDVRHLAGPWIKQRGRYSLHISAVDESMELTNEEIIDRLGETGWGVKRVNVEIVITEDRTLETHISSPDSDDT